MFAKLGMYLATSNAHVLAMVLTYGFSLIHQ